MCEWRELTTRDEDDGSHKEEDEASDDILWRRVANNLQHQPCHNAS